MSEATRNATLTPEQRKQIARFNYEHCRDGSDQRMILHRALGLVIENGDGTIAATVSFGTVLSRRVLAVRK